MNIKRTAAIALSTAALLAGGLATATTASANTGWGSIQFDAPGLNGATSCYDVPNANAYSGAQVQNWGCNGTDAQQWQLEYVDSYHFKVHSGLNYNLCLNNWEGGDTRGNHVKLYSCGSNDSVWNWVSFSNGDVGLQPKISSDNCADAGVGSGTAIVLGRCGAYVGGGIASHP
ncbi:RICIN domain-containing protein [Kitasatospora sp. NPDC053057]|uniref:RICIN domain-containing protein n=1 Tax=Kitasatospora sp. NPDC053057 TaxID=3364062 RepID=UPI0037CA8907